MQTAFTDEQDFISDVARSMPGGLYQFTRRSNGSDALPYVSDRFAEIMGVTATEVRDDATTAFARVHPDDFVDLLKSIEYSAATLETWVADFRIGRSDGSQMWLRGQSTPHKRDDGSVVWNGVLIDVTTVKCAEAALRRSHDELEQRVEERTAAVIKSEQRWQFALEGAGDGVWDWDVLSNQIFFSPRCKQLLGYGVDEMSDSRAEWENRFHPDDAAKTHVEIQRHLRGETPSYVSEGRIRCKDGRYKWILARGMAVERNRHGEPLRVIGTLTDISERKQAEVTLRERDAEMRALVDSALDGIITIDDQGLIQSFNPAATKIFGYQSAEVLGHNVSMLMPAQDRRLHDGYLRNYLFDGPNKIIGIGREVQGMRKDGSTFPLDLSLSEIKLTDRHLFLGLVHDITERKQAQDALRASEARLKSAQRIARIGSYSVNLRTNEVTWSDELYSIYGYEVGAFEPDFAQHVAPLMDPADLALSSKLIQELMTSGNAYATEYRITRKDGAARVLFTEAQRTCDSLNGSPLLIGTVRDITEHKRIEAEIIAAKDAAESANRAKSEFLSCMSHEFRTPLNAILGMSQLLELNPDEPLTDTQQEYVSDILKAGWHLLDLVGGVMDLARIEAGRMKINIGDVALEEVLPDCLKFVRPAADARGIRLVSASAGSERYVVRGDPLRLKQVLLNLLSNAVKYNRDGGTVTIGFSRPAPERVCLAVRDTGKGLTSDQLARLFEPFERLGAERGNVEGTGIGLVITKRLLELMGGSIFVTSTHGAGSTFSIELAAGSR